MDDKTYKVEINNSYNEIIKNLEKDTSLDLKNIYEKHIEKIIYKTLYIFLVTQNEFQ